MNLRPYFDRNKREIFPNITNWSDAHYDIREKSIDQVSWNEWFWFHSSAYNLIIYGSRVIFLTIFGTLAIVFCLKKVYFVGILNSIFFILTLMELIKTVKEWPANKHMTFYDLYLRD